MNTNEQTIHQMGLGISSLVKQATGRESVSSIDMDWVSVEQLARYIYGSDTGEMVSFDTNIEDGIVSLIAYIEAVQDLHGYDNPWPGGGGKNKCPVLNSETNHGMTLTVDQFGVCTLKGQSDSVGQVIGQVEFTLPAGSYIANGGQADYTLRVYNKTDASTLAIVNSTTVNVPFTLASEKTIQVFIRADVTTEISSSGLKYYPMIRLSTESDATFAPYSNLCPISGWTGANVTRTGKNLLNFTALKNAPSGELPGSSSMFTFPHVLELKLKASTKYTISTDYSSSGKQQCLYINGATSSDAVNNGNPRTVTTGADGVIKVGFFDNRTGSSEFLDGTVYVQLEEGSSASAYEAFGTTYTFTWQTEAGTVYGGTLDVLSGVLTVTHKSVTYTGADSENWSYSGEQQKSRFRIDIPDAYVIRNVPTVRTPVLCNIGYFIDTGIEELGCYIYPSDPDSPRFAYCPPIPYTMDAAAFKTWLQSNNLQIVYEIAEPLSFQLTAQEVEALIGQNTIFADTGNVSVQYKVKEDLV